MIGVMATHQETPSPVTLALVSDRSRLSEMIGHALPKQPVTSSRYFTAHALVEGR